MLFAEQVQEFLLPLLFLLHHLIIRKLSGNTNGNSMVTISFISLYNVTFVTCLLPKIVTIYNADYQQVI